MKLSEQKRLALIEAAKEEFTQFGFHAANMDRVCERQVPQNAPCIATLPVKSCSLLK